MEALMLTVLLKEIAYHTKLDAVRRHLKEGLGYNMLDLFIMIEEYESYISIEKLGKFLTRAGYDLNEEQLAAILRRADRDKDGRLSYTEFADAIMCIQKSSVATVI
jgi:hypothetical protein